MLTLHLFHAATTLAKAAMMATAPVINTPIAPTAVKVWIWRISPPTADLWFAISNAVLVFGALVVLVGTIGSSTLAAARDAFTEGRIAANEALTAQARADAATANAGIKEHESKIAEANARAAEAELGAARLKGQLAWRELSTPQLQALVTALSKQPLVVSFWVPVPDPEAMALRDQIMSAAVRAGLKISDAGTDFTANRLPFDTAVAGRERETAIWRAALEAIGLTVTTETVDADTKVYVMPKPRPR